MLLDKNNYQLFAARHYTNLHCTSLADFHRDIKIFITARTLLRVYHKSGKLKIRLLLNHIITLNNLFGPRATVRLFFYHAEFELHTYLKAIFEFLNILPDQIPEADLFCLEADPIIATILKEL
jgi:hypothetical protein